MLPFDPSTDVLGYCQSSRFAGLHYIFARVSTEMLVDSIIAETQATMSYRRD